ncbi:MAG: helical backbone metal receptor [Candidatus Omnitrophota bacterium]
MKEIKRIVSLAPSNTEIVFALGKGDQMVGVSACCDYPEQVKSIKQIGGYASPDIDKIASLCPDVVLATEIDLKKGAISKLEAKGITVAVVSAGTIVDLPCAVLSVGKLIGCPEEASELAEQIRIKIEVVTRKAEKVKQKPKVCYICSSNPLCTGTQSPVIDKLLVTAGGDNVMSGVKAETVEDFLKTVIEINPEIILISKGHKENIDLLSYAKKEIDIRQTKAYLDNKIYKIDSKLVCRPGPRAVEGLERINSFIYSESF